MGSAIRHSVLFIILLMGAVSPSYAHAASKILMFGDSLTAGYRLSANEALPAVIARKLEEKGQDVTVVNGGVSGDTTSGGVTRLAWMLDKNEPDIVFVALGGNDMLRGIPIETVRENLDKMLKVLQERDIKTILMSVKHPDERSAYAVQFNAIYPDLAAQYSVALYPFFIEPIYGNTDYMLNDGIHPNAKGVEYIAEYVADYLVGTGWL